MAATRTVGKPLTARDQKRENSKTAVLKAAAELFAHRGFEGVAIADVAKLSGVRKPNLLYYFSSKEALWKETVDWLFAQVDDFFATARTEMSTEPWEAFKHLVANYYQACRLFPAYVLIPMVEGVASSWRTDWIAKRHLSRHVHNFEGYVAVLVENGKLPQVESLHLQNLITGGAQLSIGMAPLWDAAISKDTTSEDFLDAYARTVFALLECAHD